MFVDDDVVIGIIGIVEESNATTLLLLLFERSFDIQPFLGSWFLFHFCTLV
jgi:hypothetical protein